MMGVCLLGIGFKEKETVKENKCFNFIFLYCFKDGRMGLFMRDIGKII